MTRNEEILNKAIDYSEIEDNFIEYDDCGDVCDDNAIKWIKENIDLVAMDTVNARSGYHQIVMMDDFERKFRETMEK